MKGLIFALIILGVSQGWSMRWVLENPSQQPMESQLYKVIKEFSVGSKNYVVVQTEDVLSRQGFSQVSQFLNQSFSAERSVLDIPIELADDPSIVPQDSAISGWHTIRMKYEQLNPYFQGQGIVVAVLDTGVDINHKNLKHSIWRNLREIPNNKIDDDGNGYVDDVVGWNFVGNSSDVRDTNSHGTHCAGIIAATPDGRRVERGVAPYATIMPIRIIGSSTESFLSDAAEAVVYATDNGAHVLSNSWRVYKSWGGYSGLQGIDLLQEAISYAGDRGVIFVGAAGNESKNLDRSIPQDPMFPISFNSISTLVSVASADLNGMKDIRSSFTNYGSGYVQLAAPGSKIYSTIPDNKWADMSGTSMATPLVAGAIARLMSLGYTGPQAVERLKQTVDPSAQSVWQGYVEHGLIDIYEAMKY